MRLFLFILFIFLFVNTQGQDIHFSQFKNAKSNINPALTGVQESDFLSILQRRSQWSSISDPFKTISLSLYAKEVYKKYSLGISFINDIAGLSNFTTNGLNLSTSLKLLNQKKQFFLIGAGLGAFQRSYDFNYLTFYDEEQLVNNNIFFIDLSFGGFFSRRLNNLSVAQVGFSAYHINNPNQSFSALYKLKTPVKYIFHFDLKTKYNNLQVTPSIYYSYQSKEKELIYGFELGDEKNKFSLPLKFSGALYIRDNDAIIPQFAVSYDNMEFYLSYDINISELSKASNNYGGLEFSILYHWKTKREKEKNKFICPRYL